MTDLLTSISQAPEGNREIDARVWCALHPGWEIHPSICGIGDDDCYYMVHPPGERSKYLAPPEYSTNLQALLILQNELLPGWRCDVVWRDASTAYFLANAKKGLPDGWDKELAHISLFRPGYASAFKMEHKCEKLARLSAIIKAKGEMG